MADHRQAAQNAYHLVRRNLVNNKVDVSSLPTTSLSNPALDKETFKRAVCVLKEAANDALSVLKEAANDALIAIELETQKNSDMIAMSGWKISADACSALLSKLAEKLSSDEIHWERFISLLSSFQLANTEELYQFLCWLLTLGTNRGGSKNLLLDGWWLEFWEIILLAAGDVERNPGPTFMTGTSFLPVLYCLAVTVCTS